MALRFIIQRELFTVDNGRDTSLLIFAALEAGVVLLLKGTNMMKLKRWSGVCALAALVLVLSLAVPAFVPDEAVAKDGEWKGVTLLYSSDVKGKIEPCG